MPETSQGVFYEETGDRSDPALLLLHSGGMAHQEWDLHREGFERRFRVLAPDLPGHGRTPLEGDRIELPELTEAVRGVLEHAGVPRAHVAGSSMGGSVALRLALAHPERVDRLVLFRIGFRRKPGKVREALQMDDPRTWERLGMAEWLSRIHEPQGGPEAWKDVIERAASLPDRDPPEGDLDAEALSGIQAPTLIAVGDRDPLVPVEEAVEMYRAIEEADLWVIPHATHVVAFRTWRRGIFGKEVDRFLRGARRQLG